MHDLNVLYLDARGTKYVERVLSRQGNVFAASGIKEALHLIVEHDFDYYFVDADIPEAQEFLRHLDHDPQLKPPAGVVLLTENEEEDCEAWGADTFVRRDRVREDVPYVFSHLKGTRPGGAAVLSITGAVPGNTAEERDPLGELRRGALAREAPGGAGRVRWRGGKRTDVAPREVRPGASVTARRNVRALMLAVLALLIGLTVLAWRPLLGSSGKRHSGKAKSRAKADSGKTGMKSVLVYESSPLPANSAPATSPPATPPPAPAPVAADPTVPEESASPEQGSAQLPEAPPAATNSAPSVYISGPSTLGCGQYATYTAVGSDPDGDALTYSWRTMTYGCEGPDEKDLCVTVTDSNGSSASATLHVSVR